MSFSHESNPRVTCHRPTGILTFAICGMFCGRSKLSRESNPCITFHGPTEMLTVATRVCCLAVGELAANRTNVLTFHRPNGTLRTRLDLLLQGGGLAIYGTATLTNTNVYSNQASGVRSLSALA